MEAYLAAIAYHLPQTVVSNDDLQRENPDWDMGRIQNKVGILSRHIAAPGETAVDLAEAACRKLFNRLALDPQTIDMIMLCTQTPDYLLPTSACILQHRLGLSTACGAFDYNLGCSGYVYGLFMAKAMVASGMAKKILLITAETYSKHINPRDRSVRVLFGDGATASLITAEPGGARLGEFALGTDGSGFKNLIMPASGARLARSAETAEPHTDANGSERNLENLFMDGNELFLFTLKRVPEVVSRLLDASALTKEEVDWFVFHQANTYMNAKLVAKLGVPAERAPLAMADCGNTVSNTIPLTLARTSENYKPGENVMLVGFGVGYSWGAGMIEWGDVAF